MSECSRLYHKRLPEFESFDKITLEVVPRYKQSGLSGDEWRQHVEVTFYFKGVKVHSFGSSRMRYALLMLGSHFLSEQEPIGAAIIEKEQISCDQPSCADAPTRKYILKQEFADCGEGPLPDGFGRKYRQFCEKHKTRGDCGREDSDANYIQEPPK